MSFKVQIDPAPQIMQRLGVGEFGLVQKFIDSEVLRLDDPYMPTDTGTMRRSGPLHTFIGSGEVEYSTPYVRAQYYLTPDTRGYDPQRGGHWFERMKADHKDEIIQGAKKLAGGK